MRTQTGNYANIAASADEVVVLVHGIWMTGASMWWLARKIRRCSLRTCCFSYRSIRHSPPESARKLAAYIDKIEAGTIHLVGHSLGGIVLLHLLAQQRDFPPGRVILLGSPVLGSAIARRIAAIPLLKPLLGRSIEQGLLGGAPSWSGERQLGIIAGSTQNGIGIGWLLGGVDGPSDGTVKTAETRVPGGDDYCLLNISHIGMLFSSRVASELCGFLRLGRFKQCQ